MTSIEARYRAAAALVGGLVTVVFLIVVIRLLPAPPRAALNAGSSFSAERAAQMMERLVPTGAPHPVGSATNRALKERIVQELRLLGYQPQIQEAFVCNGNAVCGEVENIFARLPGRESGPAVLLAAHYDSVAAAPGVADDLSGVVTLLESARILREGAPPRNPVVFLFDDGEEAGLLGAVAFTRLHPWAREIGAVVNLEARGTSGPSLMFETSRGNGWIVDTMANALARPATGSLFYRIYREMPNDTDFTVFRRAGIPGMNFAFIGDPLRYHTPLDDLDHLSRGSLQQQGDNALAMVRAFADADLDSTPQTREVWFDLFNSIVVHWPLGWSIVIAGIDILLFVIALVLARRRRTFGAREIGAGSAAWIVAVILPALAGAAAAWLLVRSGAFPAQWVAYPQPAIAFFWIGAAFWSLVSARLFFRLAGVDGMIGGAALWLTAIACGLAFAYPEASYVALVPSVALNLSLLAGSVLFRDADTAQMTAAGIGGVAAAAILFPIAWLTWDALGLTGAVLSGILVAIVAMTVAPLIAASGSSFRRGALIVSGIAAAGLLVAALLVYPWSVASPQHLNFTWFEAADAGESQWIVSGTELPESVERAAQWNQPPLNPAPWFRATPEFRAAGAPWIGLPPPQIRVLNDESTAAGRSLRLQVTSPRHAPRARIYIEGRSRIGSITVNGAPLLPLSSSYDRFMDPDWIGVFIATMPPDGVILDLLIQQNAPVDVFVEDVSYGLPPDGKRLLQRRPAYAAPSNGGDLSIVRTSGTI
ncbi:MAG: M28 family peptidase [Thermoanaerobaculia bacterium]